MKHTNEIWLLLSFVLMINSCGLNWEPTFNERATSGQFETVVIAGIDEALTFARIKDNVQKRVIAVKRYQAGRVDGVDLSIELKRPVDDPITVYLEFGYETLRNIITHASPKSMVSRHTDDLVMPADLAAHHIAAGLNFSEHANETSVKKGPFLFPKWVMPTGPFSEVSIGDGLLDYEVELALVPLKPIPQGQDPEDVGLILCNDYTDRATLLRHVDVDDVTSGKGFTTGKSSPGFLPVGNLFVIPRDWRGFTQELTLQLYVNHGLRQRSKTTNMIWDYDRIIGEIWKRRRTQWTYMGQPISLLGNSQQIPDRILIMSGTPQGVVFHGVPTQQKITGFLAWLMGGWGQSVPFHAIETYIDDSKAARIYLQPGDRVVIHTDRLGVVENIITR